jgi:hypothetical protein
MKELGDLFSLQLGIPAPKMSNCCAAERSNNIFLFIFIRIFLNPNGEDIVKRNEFQGKVCLRLPDIWSDCCIADDSAGRFSIVR